jgi:hypothetical protein
MGQDVTKNWHIRQSVNAADHVSLKLKLAREALLNFREPRDGYYHVFPSL